MFELAGSIVNGCRGRIVTKKHLEMFRFLVGNSLKDFAGNAGFDFLGKQSLDFASAKRAGYSPTDTTAAHPPVDSIMDALCRRRVHGRTS